MSGRQVPHLAFDEVTKTRDKRGKTRMFWVKILRSPDRGGIYGGDQKMHRGVGTGGLAEL